MRTFPPAEACRIGAQLARGLAAVHAAGLVHGDLSTRNVLFDLRARPPAVLIGDSGLAGWLRDAAGLRVPRGAHAYVAPEAVTGAVAAPTADLYALGILLYEMCAGTTPFRGEPHELLRRHLDFPPRRPDGFPDRLWVLVAALLAKDPGSRPGPARAIAGYLDAIADAVAAVPPALAPIRPAPLPRPGASPVEAADSAEAVTAPRPRLALPSARPAPFPVVGAADETLVLPVLAAEPPLLAPAATVGPAPVEAATTVPSARVFREQAARRRGMLITALAVVLPLILIVGVRTLTGTDQIADESASIPGDTNDDLTPDHYRGEVVPDPVSPSPFGAAAPTAGPSVEDQIAALADLAGRQGGAVEAGAEAHGRSEPAPESPVGTGPSSARTTAPRVAQAPPLRTPSPHPVITPRPSAPATPRPTTGPNATAAPSASATPEPSFSPPAASSGTPSPETGEG